MEKYGMRSYVELGKPVHIEHKNSDGKLHRLDGPAYIGKSKYVTQLIGSPEALETEAYTEEWRINGKLHRLDGPAYYCKRIVKSLLNGENITYTTLKWYNDGILHRIGGPAIMDGSNQEWYVNGQHHNLDGYAYFVNGEEKYFIEGYELNKKLFDEYTKLLSFKTMITTTLDTIRNSHVDTGEHDDYYNIPKELVDVLLEKIL